MSDPNLIFLVEDIDDMLEPLIMSAIDMNLLADSLEILAKRYREYDS